MSKTLVSLNSTLIQGSLEPHRATIAQPSHQSYHPRTMTMHHSVISLETYHRLRPFHLLNPYQGGKTMNQWESGWRKGNRIKWIQHDQTTTNKKEAYRRPFILKQILTALRFWWMKQYEAKSFFGGRVLLKDGTLNNLRKGSMNQIHPDVWRFWGSQLQLGSVRWNIAIQCNSLPEKCQGYSKTARKDGDFIGIFSEFYPLVNSFQTGLEIIKFPRDTHRVPGVPVAGCRWSFW